jgi:hypothetical protein
VAGDALSSRVDARVLRVLWRKHALVLVKAGGFPGSGMSVKNGTRCGFCSLVPQQWQTSEQLSLMIGDS